MGNENLADLRETVKFYEEVRVWMAKFDAQERQVSGQPVPAEIQRLLSGLVDTSTATGEILDIYEAAGLPKPTLSELGPDFLARAQQADHAHLAIEALRDTLTAESGKVARGNLVRQRAFSDRLKELMNKYTNQQLTSAEVIAGLVELARQVAAEDDRGKSFDPPLSEDELAFFDAGSENESAVQVQGEDVLAQIARELVAVMRRDREDRLDGARRRPREAALVDQAAAGEVQVPARQAARRYPPCHRADGGRWRRDTRPDARSRTVDLAGPATYESTTCSTRSCVAVRLA